MSAGAAEPTECASCGSARRGAYCSACGQKFAPINPTLGYFLYDLTHELLNVDGKIFRSVRLLLTRPGFLTREILAGRRSPYVSPIRLYLTFSILFFVTLAFVPEAIRMDITYTPSPGEVPLDPQQVEQRTSAALQAVNDVTNRWAPRIMFLFVPLFAALVHLVSRKSGRNYPQHLYFALHVHAVWFFLGAIAVLATATDVRFLSVPIVSAAWVCAALYFGIAYRRVYETKWARAFWRCVLVLIPYALIVLATLLAIWIPTALETFQRQS